MSNDDKLKVRQTESKKKAFKELTIIRDIIFWIDVVGEGQNENAIFARPFNDKGAFPQKLTTKETRIAKLIAKDLKKENIFFAGIDFIDQKLNGDINVTSPTGLKTLYDLSGKNLAKTFWRELKA